MAQITLGAGETANGGQPIFGNNTIFGTTTGAGQTVVIGGGQQIFGADFNAGGDTIILSGAASQYSISRSGSTIIITGPNGTEVRFPAPSPALGADQQPNIIFNNGTLTNTADDVSYKLSTSTAGVISLGTQSVTTTPAAVGGGGNPQPGALTLNVTATNPTVEGGAITYTFTLSQAPTSAVTINVSTVGGTATAGSDYTPVAQTITFPAGQTTAFLTVSTIADGNTGEAAETVQLQVNLPAGVTLAGTANLIATIPADPIIPQQFILTTGNDTAIGTAAPDRIVGAQDTTLPGKLLSANDIVNGGEGVDTLELTNSPGNPAPNVLADLDFTNVTNVEALVTNYANVQLGAQADKAGIVSVDTATRVDAANIAGGVFGGTLLDLTSDANNDGVSDFNNVLNVTMANSVADTIRLTLNTSAGSGFNTGTTFTPIGGGAAFGVIDNVQIVGQPLVGTPAAAAPVRVTFTSANVGNGSAFDADGTTLAVAVQSEDGNDGLTGGVTRFDDEGIRFTGGAFDVRDVSGTQRGTFAEVVLGTSLSETINASGGSSYINAGGGNDTVNGTGGIDFLVGGAGNDNLNGFGGNDNLLGGAGNDVLNGGAGIDVMDGGEGSDRYVFANGEFDPAEAITDTGTGANDIDTLDVTSSTALTDAQFANKLNFEALVSNVTTGGIGGTAEVTLAANAQASGIRTVTSDNDDIDASAYTVGLTVTTGGNITTGTGNDTANLVGFQNYAGAVNVGAGDDTVNAGYALNNNANNTLNGGTGTDTLAFGGALAPIAGRGNNIGYTNPFGTNMTGFERITIAAAEGAVAVAAAPDQAGNAVSYTFTFADANVAAGSTFVVDGSALRAGVIVGLGPDGEIGGNDDTTANEVLTVNATALAADRAVSVTGGAANDILTGGAGADTLNGGAGNDTLNGGAGADTLNGGAGADILIGGAGNDTMNGGDGGDDYRFGDGELVAGDVIADDGVTGADTISFTSSTVIGDAVFANKTGIEALNTNVTANPAGAEVTIGVNAQAAGIRSVNSGDDDIDASAYTAGLTVNSGTQVVNGVATSTGHGNITTGSGNDIVNLTGISAYSGTGAIVLGAGDDILNAGYTISFQGGSTAHTSATISGGAGRDVLQVGGAIRAVYGNSGFVGTDIFNFAANANFTGFEQITILGSDQALARAGQSDLAGNSMSYNITLAQANVAAATSTFVVDATGLVPVVVNLGADGEIGGGDDGAAVAPILTLNATAVTSALDVRGGSGNDVINTGAGADIINGGAGNDTINGGAGNDVIDGGDGNDILTGGDGFDVIRGGAGNDTIVLTVSQFNSDADTVDGGAGTDTLQINGTLAAQEVADVGFNGRFTSIEQITLVGAGPDGIAGNGDDANTAFTYTAGFYSQQAAVNTINVGANASGSTVSIANYTSGGPGNFPAPTVTLNDILVTTNNTTFIGSAFADTFNLGVTNTAQGGGTDLVTGGAGDDVFNFGSTYTAADLVNGGAGNDTLNVSGNGTTQTVTLAVAAVGGANPTTGIYSVETINLASGLTGTAGVVGGAVGTAGTVTTYNVTVQDTAFESATSTLTVNGGGLRLISTGAGADGTFGTADDVTTAEVLTYDGSAVTGTRVQVVTGGAGGDSITGGAGNDTLTGGAGNDTVNGGAGNDVIDGGTGDDTLNGGAGNDTITGGAGADTIDGGAGVDIINLGADGARDRVIISANGDAPRAAQAGIETVNGFQTGVRGAGPDTILGNGDDTFTATADVIDFGTGIIATTSTSIANGVVQAGSVLANAINSSTSLLAAIQLVEQEFQGGSDPAANNGVVAFVYQGNTYVGEITGAQGLEAFVDIVQLSGVSNIGGLFNTGGTNLGVYAAPAAAFVAADIADASPAVAFDGGMAIMDNGLGFAL